MYYCLFTQLFINSFLKGVLIRDSVYQLSKEKITIPTTKKTDVFFFHPIVAYCNDAKEKRLLMNHQTSIFG